MKKVVVNWYQVVLAFVNGSVFATRKCWATILKKIGVQLP